MVLFFSRITTLFLFIACQFSFAQTSVWQASNGENTVYFGGTVHMLRDSDYPLPEAFDRAYANSDELYFEIDIAEMDGVEAQMSALQQLMYTDGRNLQSVLNDEAFAALNEYISLIGVPMMLLQNMKPGMLASTLEIMAFQNLGFTPQGVDMHFYQRAQADAKNTVGLESVQEQIAFLAGLGEGEESEFILLSLRELDTIAEDIETMLRPWREGDIQDLDELFVGEMKEEVPESYELLVAGRNRNWMPEIINMLGDPDTEFVLVGVAHLIGEDGLVELLRNRGYQVRQL